MWNLFIAHRWSLLLMKENELLTPAIKYYREQEATNGKKEYIKKINKNIHINWLNGCDY